VPLQPENFERPAGQVSTDSCSLCTGMKRKRIVRTAEVTLETEEKRSVAEGGSPSPLHTPSETKGVKRESSRIRPSSEGNAHMADDKTKGHPVKGILCCATCCKVTTAPASRPRVGNVRICESPDSCCDSLAARAAEHVAAAVRYHNEHESVEEPPCQGCTCMPYEVLGPARSLRRRIEERYVAWQTDDNKCIYKVDFIVSIAETVIPRGFCRPDRSGKEAPEPPSKEIPHVATPPGDTAPVTGESKTHK